MSTFWWLGSAGLHGAEESITGQMMLLVMQLGTILFAAKLGGLLFTRLKLPGVLGELLSGMVVGPFALGGLALPGFPEGLFPLMADGGAVSPALYAFGAVAAVVLLLDVGLETDLKLLLRYAAAGGLVGLGGILVSFAGGVAATALLAGPLLGLELGFMHPVSLFMGVVSTATSVGITARILSERGKLDSPEGVTILSAAVVDDVIGIILLAVVLGMVSATSGGEAVNWGRVGWIAVKAFGVWLFSTLIGVAGSRRISWCLKLLRDPMAMAVLALGLALLMAGLFEQAGLAMIIGAYVTGLSLSQTDIRHVLREQLHPISLLLVPVFFSITGMMIDLRTLLSGPVLQFGFFFTLVAFVSKLLGCGLPALLANFNGRGALRIGLGMVPRGEVGLIVAGIGTRVALMPGGGALPGTLFASVVLMVMTSTLLGPPLLSLALRSPLRGSRRTEAESENRQQIVVQMSSEEMTAFFLQKLEQVFEDEGYFWHRLDRELMLYQMRKNASVLDLQVEDCNLIFRCDPGDSGVVRGMLLEAGASLEQALRRLQRPFDAKALGHDWLSSTDSVGTPSKYKLSQFFTEARILPELQGRSKAEVIDELLAVLVAQGDLTDVAAARTAVWEREAKMSTALEEGVAIPHGKTDAVSRLVCAMGICREGIDAAALDGKPARFFVLTLSPKSKPTPHVQFMAAVSQFLNETGRAFLSEPRTRGEIFRYLQG